jgi:hypothetical protein
MCTGTLSVAPLHKSEAMSTSLPHALVRSPSAVHALLSTGQCAQRGNGAGSSGGAAPAADDVFSGSCSGAGVDVTSNTACTSEAVDSSAFEIG